MIASTVTLWNADYGGTKPVRVGEAGPYGGSYPSSDHNHEERRKIVWFTTACVQAIGTYGFQSFQVQPLDSTDQAILDSSLVDRISGTGWLNFVSLLNNKTWVRDYNVGTLRVSVWRDPTTGRRAYVTNSTTGSNSNSVDFFGKPTISNVYDSYGSLLYSNRDPASLSSISVSTQAFIIQELQPPGAFMGRE
jgi:hypothetical protein